MGCDWGSSDTNIWIGSDLKLTYNQTDNIETEALHKMTVSISIRPALEDRLAARARSTGQSLEDFIQAVLEREATLPGNNGSSELTGAEKARAFHEWTKSFPPNLPVLSLENVSREQIYQRD